MHAEPLLQERSLRHLALEALCTEDPAEKVAATRQLHAALQAGHLSLDPQSLLTPDPGAPVQ